MDDAGLDCSSLVGAGGLKKRVGGLSEAQCDCENRAYIAEL